MLVIAGFQVYWLRENYKREKNALEVKTNLLFRETVQHLQDSTLKKKLFVLFKDKGVKDFKRSKEFRGTRRVSEADIAVKVLGSLQKSLPGDSFPFNTMKIPPPGKMDNDKRPHLRTKSRPPGVFVQLDSINPQDIREMVVVNARSRRPPANIDSLSSTLNFRHSGEMGQDSARGRKAGRIEMVYFNNDNGDKVTVRMDSLVNDSIPLQKITSEFSAVLKEQKMQVPFVVLKQHMQAPPDDNFERHPFPGGFPDYSLQLGDTVSFLLGKISMAILFSLFLVGITVFSFILLYRSLLRQHRLAQFKNDLISNITHELKTPIATVGVAIEALKNFNAIHDTKKTSEYLDISQQELQRLGLLVDKVLKLSMFENKKIEINADLVDLGTIVNEVVASLRLQLEKYHASISVHTEGDLNVKGDKLHLLSVVFNLLDNALKYSKGDAAIEVEISGQAKEVILKVKDNGIGIPGMYREKIFEKFFRVPTGDKHDAKGHGLGLSYSAQVIRQHQGTIKVESKEGEGSVFIITIPKQFT